jgi:non-homologous end joining protein Ku
MHSMWKDVISFGLVLSSAQLDASTGQQDIAS